MREKSALNVIIKVNFENAYLNYICKFGEACSATMEYSTCCCKRGCIYNDYSTKNVVC